MGFRRGGEIFQISLNVTRRRGGGVAFNSPTYIVASDDEIDAVVGGRPSR